MRQIEQKMIDFLDQKLSGNGAAQEAIKEKDARSLFAFAVESCVGIRESGGNNKGPLVELLQETIGKAQREAWCMSFIQTCVAYAEVKTGVKSHLPASEHCLTVWNKTLPGHKVQRFPARGAIAIWQHGDSTAGHTGMFIEAQTLDIFFAIEGNTEGGLNPGGAVVRDGGGVYKTKRNMKGAGSMRLRGFIKPF